MNIGGLRLAILIGALAGASALDELGPTPRRTYRPRKPDPKPQCSPRSEIEEWNATVEQRKAQRRADREAKAGATP
jgi:hypothetical protein